MSERFSDPTRFYGPTRLVLWSSPMLGRWSFIPSQKQTESPHRLTGGGLSGPAGHTGNESERCAHTFSEPGWFTSSCPSSWVSTGPSTPDYPEAT